MMVEVKNLTAVNHNDTAKGLNTLVRITKSDNDGVIL